jgi:hypothetical protein
MEERILEVVQGAEALRSVPLGPQGPFQVGLQLLSLGDVEHDAVDQARIAVLVPKHDGVVPEPHHSPVPGDHPVLVAEWLAAGPTPEVRGQRLLPVLRVQRLVPELRVPAVLIRGKAQDRLDLRAYVHGGHGLVDQVGVGDGRDLLDQGAVLGLGVAELALDPLSVRDVAGHHLYRRFARVRHWGRGDLDFDGCPVQPEETFLDWGHRVSLAEPLEPLQNAGTRVRVNELEDGPLGELLRGAGPEQPRRSEVGEHDPTLFVHGDRVRGELDQPPIAFFGFPRVQLGRGRNESGRGGRRSLGPYALCLVGHGRSSVGSPWGYRRAAERG